MTRRTVIGSGGTELSVLTAGHPKNPAIVFVHGWSQSALSWKHQFAELAEEFYLVAPDLRGHGASEKPVGDEHYFSSEPWAHDLAAVISEFDLDIPILVGWSMGGYVVQDYISVCGEDAISAAVLIGTGVTKGALLPQAAIEARKADDAVSAHGMLDEDPAVNIAATLEFIRACTAKPLHADDFGTAVAFNMACPTAVRRACRVRPGDYREAMAAVKIPIHVMWGDQERLSHRTMLDEMMDIIPHATCKIYEGLGHMPFFEDPSAFNADLADFVRSQDIPTRRVTGIKEMPTTKIEHIGGSL